MAMLVQKYGGTSIADPQRIQDVAARIGMAHDEGNNIVVVVSAMGHTTDHLIQQAQEISRNPDPRELDLLLSTGEIVSCTLMAIALRARGYNAISLSGGQLL